MPCCGTQPGSGIWPDPKMLAGKRHCGSCVGVYCDVLSGSVKRCATAPFCCQFRKMAAPGMPVHRRDVAFRQHTPPIVSGWTNFGDLRLMCRRTGTRSSRSLLPVRDSRSLLLTTFAIRQQRTEFAQFGRDLGKIIRFCLRFVYPVQHGGMIARHDQ